MSLNGMLRDLALWQADLARGQRRMFTAILVAVVLLVAIGSGTILVGVQIRTTVRGIHCLTGERGACPVTTVTNTVSSPYPVPSPYPVVSPVASPVPEPTPYPVDTPVYVKVLVPEPGPTVYVPAPAPSPACTGLLGSRIGC